MLPDSKTVILSLEQELRERLRFKERFQQLWAEIPPNLRDLYLHASYESLVLGQHAGQILAHARNLGLPPRVDKSVKVGSRKEPRSLERQARDYIRYILDFEGAFNAMIDESVKRKRSRFAEYAYLEHLTR